MTKLKNNTDMIDEEYLDEFDEDEFDNEMMSGAGAQMVTQVFPSIISASIDLSKMIVDNRRHNSKKMTDKDIQEIYQSSFDVVSSVMGKGA
jgi:hypothetical protein